MPEDKFEQTTNKEKPLIVELGVPFLVKPDFNKTEVFFRNDLVIVNSLPFVITDIGEGKVIIATFMQEISSLEQRTENNIVTPLGEIDFTINPNTIAKLPYPLPVTVYIEMDVNYSIAHKIGFQLSIDEKSYKGKIIKERLVKASEFSERLAAYNWLDPDKYIPCSPYFPPTGESFSQIKFIITKE